MLGLSSSVDRTKKIMFNTPLIAIVGPTAVGKSTLALHLPHIFGGEIVSADSRQVYKGMDIGTAKPSLQERSQVPHHLIDILDPDQPYSLESFLQLAHHAIQDIHSRGALPLVVGGTGQYLWALLEEWRLPPSTPDGVLRSQLEEEAQTNGVHALHDRLKEADPEAAATIDPRNVRRVIRALEIYQSTGKLPSKLRTKEPSPYRVLIIGLTLERKELYRRIDCRVDMMMEMGLLEEARGILERGYSPSLPAMSSIGYKEMMLHLSGQLTLEEAVRRIKFETHRFVRRQYTWFSLKDPRIRWLEAAPDTNHQAQVLVERFLAVKDDCDKIASHSQLSTS